MVVAGLAFGAASFYGGGLVGRRLLRPSGLTSTVRLVRNPPGVDLSGLTPEARATVIERLNTEICPCGCNLTLARCRRTDPTCDTSLPRAREIVDQARRRQD